MRYTVYIERDIAIDVRDDRQAAAIADSLDTRVTAAIRTLTVEERHAATVCHRGENNKQVFDSREPV